VALTKVCCDFWCVDLILLLMVLFSICGFNTAIRVVHIFVIGGVILFVSSL
jgi:hypothetical protein